MHPEGHPQDTTQSQAASGPTGTPAEGKVHQESLLRREAAGAKSGTPPDWGATGRHIIIVTSSYRDEVTTFLNTPGTKDPLGSLEARCSAHRIPIAHSIRPHDAWQAKADSGNL